MSDPAEHPSSAALLVVDVQNDFCPGGALAVPRGDDTVPILDGYIALFQRLALPIFLSRDWHPTKSRHFAAFGGRWPPHCVQGTVGADLHPRLTVPADAHVISKGTSEADDGYSAFEGHEGNGASLEDSLVRRGIGTVYIGGLATEYCVRASALDALRKGFAVVLLVDAIRALDASDGERAVDEMQRTGARLATIDDVERTLGR